MVSENAKPLSSLKKVKQPTAEDGPLNGVAAAASKEATLELVREPGSAEAARVGEAEAAGAGVAEAEAAGAGVAEAEAAGAGVAEAEAAGAGVAEAEAAGAGVAQAEAASAGVAEAEAAGWAEEKYKAEEATALSQALALDPLLVAFDSGGRSCLSRFDKTEFDRALGAHLPGLLLADGGDTQLRQKMLALLDASPASALPYEFSLLFSAAERRRVCDLRAVVCLDYYLDRFASAFRDLPDAVSIGECVVCACDGLLVRQRRCCCMPVCAACLAACARFTLTAGRPRIGCPNCPASLNRDEVRQLCLHDRPDLLRRYDQLLVEADRDPGVKTCPACGHICRRDRPSGLAAANADNEVECEACGTTWCFACHGPRHPGRRCPDPADSDGRLLIAWSHELRRDEDAAIVGAVETRRARNCPECRALIERDGGCRHVTCTVCHTEFCYLCGKRLWQEGRYLGLLAKRHLGGHESRLSVFGCSANFLPSRPRLRRALRRGLLVVGVGGAALAVLAVSPLLLLSSPVWAPLLAVRERRRGRVRERSSS